MTSDPSIEHRELLVGLIRLHILHHAAEGDIYGQWIIEELARHGYRLSPPMLHAMEQRGYLRSRAKKIGRSVRAASIARPREATRPRKS